MPEDQTSDPAVMPGLLATDTDAVRRTISDIVRQFSVTVELLDDPDAEGHPVVRVWTSDPAAMSSALAALQDEDATDGAT